MNTEKTISEITRHEHGGFDKMELLKTYPEPVARYLRFHLPEGIPDRSHGEVRLKGIIKIVNWSHFKSTLFANPFRGFLWTAKVKMGILPVNGYDYFLDDAGAMQWQILNLIPVMKGSGSDISRSAEGRARMEGAFFPDLLIHPKVKWGVISDNEITASWKINKEEQPVHFKIGDDGSLRKLFIQRWGNPGDTKVYGYHWFGSNIHSEALHQGVMIPKKGDAGWWFGEKGYDDGEFFRFESY
jgi:hypothetical protein